MPFYLHYFLHLVFPFFIAWLFFREHTVKTGFIFLLTMIVDADHLLATPVYDPNRCSIGFHPLHSYLAITVYFLLLIPKRSRVVAIGLLMHMGTDWLDCYWQSHF